MFYTREGRPVTHGFGKEYWDQHWHRGRFGGPGSMSTNPPNPYLAHETGGLVPGTALDAGCGAGGEAIWLAAHGWRVTAVDISATALALAAERATASGAAGHISWVEADLSTWYPSTAFDLVTTHYAHTSVPQLEFHDRIAAWVAPGGTLLIVGHMHSPDTAADADRGGHGQTPAHASVTAAAITARLDPAEWEVVTADEPHRTLTGPGRREVSLHDVVVRATRRH